MEILFIIAFGVFLIGGIWFAKSTQDFIDFKNAQARLDQSFKKQKEREERKWQAS